MKVTVLRGKAQKEEDDEEPQTSQGQRDVEKEAFTDEEGDETPVERIQTFVADAAEVDAEGTRHSNNQQRKEGKEHCISSMELKPDSSRSHLFLVSLITPVVQAKVLVGQ